MYFVQKFYFPDFISLTLIICFFLYKKFGSMVKVKKYVTKVTLHL